MYTLAINPDVSFDQVNLHRLSKNESKSERFQNALFCRRSPFGQHIDLSKFRLSLQIPAVASPPKAPFSHGRIAEYEGEGRISRMG